MLKLILILLFPLTALAFNIDENYDQFKNKELTLSTLPKNKIQQVRVMWWNIEVGMTNRILAGHPLDKNLVELANSPIKPEILVLGEYGNEAIEAHTHIVLNQNYPYRIFTPYNRTSDNRGIKVYSTTPLTMKPVRNLDWVPTHITNEAKKNIYRETWRSKYPLSVKYFNRPYVNIKIQTDFGDFYLLPFHAVEPWDIIMKSWGKLRNTIGKFSVGMLILLPDFSYTEPLSAQFYNFKQEMIKDFGEELNQESFLFFGDFNVPMSYRGVSSRVRRMFSSLLDCLTDNDAITFPAFSAPVRKEFGPLRIDHAFSSKNLKVSHSLVLELKGSDHYPTYFVINGQK